MAICLGSINRKFISRNSIWVFYFGLFLTIVLPVSAKAQVEINGLLVDQTRTMFGREFFREFSSAWGEPEVPVQYNIVITEYFDARWGSLIIIELNGREAYRKRLAPRSGDASQEAKAALPSVRRYLMYLMTTKNQSINPDLKGDGL